MAHRGAKMAPMGLNMARGGAQHGPQEAGTLKGVGGPDPLPRDQGKGRDGDSGKRFQTLQKASNPEGANMAHSGAKIAARKANMAPEGPTTWLLGGPTWPAGVRSIWSHPKMEPFRGYLALGAHSFSQGYSIEPAGAIFMTFCAMFFAF